MIVVNTRYFDRSTERCLRDGHVDFTVNVLAIPSESLTRFHSKGNEDFRDAEIHAHGLSVFHT